MLTVVLNKNEELNILKGFPWVFNNEIYTFKGDIINGDVVKVVTFDNRFVGYGFININSKIMVRMLSLKEDDVIDYNFYKRRIVFVLLLVSVLFSY